MNKYSLLPNKQGGGGNGFDSLSQILEQLLQLQGGGGKQPAETASPSAAPVGQPTATAGLPSQLQSMQPAGNVNMTAPIPKGMPKSQAGSQLMASSAGAGGGFQSAGAGAGAPSGAGAIAPTGGGTSVPTGQYSGIDTSGFSLTGQGYGQTATDTGPTPAQPDNKTSFGDALGAFGELGDAAIDAYNAFSLDEGEKLARAERHIKEQQFAIRQNWKGVYEDFLLPITAGTKMYAYQQLGKKSDNYEYATDMLKGMIEGSASVYAGQKDWDQVWDSLSKIPDENIPDTFAESWQSHYQNDTVNNTAWAITTKFIDQLIPGMAKGIASGIALELLKIGNATIKSALDMKLV